MLHRSAIRIWNSTKTGNKRSITGPKNNINDDIAPLKSCSDLNLIAESKKSLRKELLSRRNLLSKSEVNNLSKLISDRFASLPVFKESKNIAIYSPINNEVDTAGLFRTLLENGKSSFFPKIVNNELYFHKISKPEELEYGSFGIPEPGGSADLTGINEIDLFIVPGLGFDNKGSRIGYGKGFYDRALKDVSSSKIYAFCYSFQILNNVPTSENDKRVGFIVSESGVVSTKI